MNVQSFPPSFTFLRQCALLPIRKRRRRSGRNIIPKPIVKSAPSLVRNARERSLGARGANIFNLLSENIRSMNTDHIDRHELPIDCVRVSTEAGIAVVVTRNCIGIWDLLTGMYVTK